MAADLTLQERRERFIAHTYDRHPLQIVDGRGCRLVDAEGNEYLDLLGGIAVSVLGHRHPSLVQTLREAADGLWHVSNLYDSEPQVRLAERLAAATGMDRTFFCNSGAEAVEAALKMARRAGGPERRKLVAAEGGFHGRTLGALSLTAKERYREPFTPLVPGVTHVPFGDADALEEAVDDETAAVFLEAVQGEGGVQPAPPGYLEAAKGLCEERGALLVLDEIQSGMGRTGTFLAAERYGVLPDIVCLAKGLAGGLPIGAALARGRAAQAFEPGDHGSTFGGGPLVCKVALAVLDELLRPGFLESVRLLGSKLGEGLSAVVRDLDGVEELRGAGLMWGLAFHDEVAAEVVTRLREHGVLAGVAGPRVLRLLPPLVLSPEEAREAVETVGKAVGEVLEP